MNFEWGFRLIGWMDAWIGFLYHFWMGHPRCLPQAVQRQWGSLLRWMKQSGWCHLQQPADQPIGHASASLALTVVQSGICWSQKWHYLFGQGDARRNNAPGRHPLFSGSEIHKHKHKHSSTGQIVSCTIMSDVPFYIHILPVGGWGHAGRSPVTLGCWEAESHFLWVAALRETQLTVAALGTPRPVSVGKFMLIFKSHKCGSLLALSRSFVLFLISLLIRRNIVYVVCLGNDERHSYICY